MTLAAAIPIQRAATLLLDAGHVAWSVAELTDYLNAAQRSILQVKGDAYSIRDMLRLAAGVDQELPPEGLSLINIHRNSVSKRACWQAGHDLMNAFDPQWANRTPAVDVQIWIADQREPRRFMVYPPNDGTGIVQATYGATPPTVTSVDDELVLPDSYDLALTQGILFCAFSKNSRRQDLQKAAASMQMMNALVTGKTATIKLNAPDLKQVEQAQS